VSSAAVSRPTWELGYGGQIGFHIFVKGINMKNIVKSSLKTLSMVMVLGIYQNFAYAADNDVSEAAETEVIAVVINGKEITVTLADVVLCESVSPA